MAYRLILAQRAKKEFDKAPKDVQSKVARNLRNLLEVPYMGKKLADDLRGFRAVRAWPFRIIYFVNEVTKTVHVDTIQHRKDVYR